MKKVLTIILTVLFIALIFTGCESDSANAIIYYEINEMPRTVDPQLAKTTSELLISRNIYEGLMREDEEGNVVNGAAKEYSSSGQTYTFILRDNIKWSDGKSLTAQDFVYGIKRGADPKNNAPYAEKLLVIKNAKKVISGDAPTSTLGVSVVDNATLKIEVEAGVSSKELFELLSLPIAMPCRNDFFEECNGKYGMTSENTLSNGSYRLRLWDTENNKLRIWTNPHYNGDFIAKNSAVIFTYDSDKTAFERLKDGNVDIAQIETSDIADTVGLGLNTVEFENISWLLTLNKNKYSHELRKAFCSSFNRDKYSSALIKGYTVSSSVFPKVITKDESISPVSFNGVDSVLLYKSAVAGLKDKSAGTIEIIYYNDPIMHQALVDIAGNWQNLFGVTVNLTPSDELEALQKQLVSPTYDMCLFPVISTDGDKANYLKYFKANKTDLQKLQNDLVGGCVVIPVATQNTCFAYSSDLTSIKVTLKTGTTDFSYVIKKD